MVSQNPGPPEVLVTKAQSRTVPVYREWIGTLDGSENAQIRARVSGYVLRRNYKEGTYVPKGTLLFEIDPRPFEAALAEAKGQLSQAQATQLATESEYVRNKQLFNKKVISEQEYINYTQLNYSAVAKIQTLQANVEQARLNLEFCKVVSPIDGVVGLAQAQVGDLVGTQGTVLTSVSTLDPLKVLFPISESEYFTAREQLQKTLDTPFEQRPKTIQLIFADGTVYPYKARMLSIDRQVQAATGTILVTALVENPGNVLRPGFFARARVLAKNIPGAVVVPERSVSEVQGSYQIGVIGDNNCAEIRPVQVGDRASGEWVITEGLKPGERVVVEGLQKIKSGAPVVPKDYVAQAPPAPPEDQLPPVFDTNED